MASIQERVIGAMRLNVPTYEEVEHDQNATGQAALVVLIGAVSSGIASASVTALVLTIVAAFLGWGIGSYVLLLVGTKLLPGKNTEADIGQVLRGTGFAQSPRIFAIVGIIPILGLLISFALGIWTLVAMVIAVRQVFDYDDTLRAIVVAVIAWVIMVVIYMMMAALGIGAAVVGGALS